MYRNLIHDSQLKENIADTAFGILEEGKDYHEAVNTRVEFGYIFDIDDHGLEVLFKLITDVDTFYFAIQGKKMMRLTFTEEQFQLTVETFMDTHPVEEEEELDGPGLGALLDECERVYPGSEPLELTPLIKWRFGGEEPLDLIRIYDAGDYWHFVTFGLTELYEKEAENEEYSGYGMEFTFKLKKDTYEDTELELRVICSILQHIARITFTQGDIFEANQYIYTGQTEGIDAKQESNITGFIMVADDKFQSLQTPFGKVDFVEFIGVTNTEIEAVKDQKITVSELREKLPSDVTDYHRESVI